MGWERRGQRRYYVRKRRINGRVVSEYVGSGEIGRLAESEDEQKREEKRQAKEREDAEKAQLKQIDDAISEFSDEIKQLVLSAKFCGQTAIISTKDNGESAE